MGMISHKTLNIVCLMFKNVKSFFMCSSTSCLHSAAVALNLFPGSEAYGRIPVHDFSASRKLCSHCCTGELKITVDRSNCVTSGEALGW